MSSARAQKRSMASSGSVVQVLGRPVVAEPGRVVEHALQLGVRHLGDHLAVGLQLEHRRR